MTIIADASSLILLSKVSILETFASRNDVATSRTVYQEVIKGKEKGRSDSMLVEKLVQENRLKIKTPSKSIKNKIEKLLNLKKGELDVISLAYKTNHVVLTDDKKCLNAAKVLDVDFIISLDVIITLYKKRVITKEKAFECINNLEDYGWYSKDLIKKYLEVATKQNFV